MPAYHAIRSRIAIPTGKLLTREQERELATELARIEVAAWEIALADPEIIARARSLFELTDRSKIRTAAIARGNDHSREWMMIATAVIKKQASPPSPQYQALAELNRDAERIRAAFIQMNQGLVHMMVRRRMRRRLESLQYEDLVQAGNLGLLRAIGSFDPNVGARFSTYSIPWIRQRIDREVHNVDEMIRRTVHLHSGRTASYLASERLRLTLGRDPTDAEVAADLGIKTSKVIEYRSSAMARVVSTDAPIRNDSDATLGSVIEDPSSVDPTDAIATEERRAALQSALKHLRPREREILEKRFGIGNGEASTLGQAGVSLGLSRERVRQIEGVALDKLRRLLPRAMRDDV